MMKNGEKQFNIFKYLKKYKWQYALFIFLMALSSVISITVLTIITSNFVSSFSQTLNIEYAFNQLIIIFSVSMVTIVINTLEHLLGEHIIESISYDAQLDIAFQTFKLNASSYSQNSASNFVSRVLNDPVEIFSYLAEALSILSVFISELIIVIYISTLNVWIGLFIIVFSIIAIIINKKYIKVFSNNRAIGKKKGEKVSSLMIEVVKSERDIKTLNLENSLKQEIQEVCKDYTKFKKKANVINRNFHGFYRLFITCFGSLLIFLALHLMDKGLLAFGTFVIIYYNQKRAASLVSSFNSLTQLYSNIQLSVSRINELFDEQDFVTEHFGSKELEQVKGEIEFKNVSFSYNIYREKTEEEIKQEKKRSKKKIINYKVKTGKNQVLDNLSFTIKPNTTVAFVGKSGAGKTTILNLISKLYEADSGQVLLDGEDICTLNKKTLRKSISLVNQFPYIFNMSIRKNLLLANKNATEEEINQAIKDSALDEFVSTLPQGLETELGESGVRLSGGQRQRLAIARALLRKSPIIIFDESTSSLDNLAQNVIKKSINNIKGKGTIIIVAHRLSTIQDVDKIFFLESGKIVDTGTFDELITSNEKFKELFYAQSI